ncbi:MAG: hypothetical protein HIU90_09535 [Proteobacteria bacterium]|nr:hypothetical protein [Pseudomonadota bacterium]
MRQVFATILLGLAALYGACTASAQVVVNQQALQQLSGKPVAPQRPVVRRPYRPIVRRPVVRRRAVMRPLPLPPPPPPVSVPVVAAVPPPPKPARPRAVTLVFPSVDVALPGGAARRLSSFIGAKVNARAHYVVQATAPGIASDPSVARRMALNRGLAVRAVLRRAGVSSDHIIVQALGNPPGIVPDHVTLTEIP